MGRAARSPTVARRNGVLARGTQSGAWGPSSRCWETPLSSSQRRQPQDGRGVGTTTGRSAGRPGQGEDSLSQTIWGSRAESGGITRGRRAPVAPRAAERPGERVLGGRSSCPGWGRLPSESSWPAGRRRATPRPSGGEYFKAGGCGGWAPEWLRALRGTRRQGKLC